MSFRGRGEGWGGSGVNEPVPILRTIFIRLFRESQLKEFLCGSTVEEDLTGEIVRNDGFNGLKDSRVKCRVKKK